MTDYPRWVATLDDALRGASPDELRRLYVSNAEQFYRVYVGLSGVVYAYFGFLLVSQTRQQDFARVLPTSTIRLMLGWLVICFVLSYTGVLPVANFAHLGGLVIGCILGLAAYPNIWQKRGQIAALGIGVLSFIPLFWAPWQEQWLVANAYRALLARDEAGALTFFEQLRTKHPANTWALQSEATIHLRKGQYAKARDRLSRLAQNSANAELLNRLAWLLATCPDAKVRDGAQAVVSARRACEMDDWKTAAYVDTLAAAYAEAGDFKSAEKYALQALEKPGPHARLIEEHLTWFRSAKPWREP